ncbi:hypothetical protein Q9L58_005912 [Maublancomyces gigas]|uniref:Pre-mRNA-splicing factor 38B n=1 Tax=Discina gigas TaxID=1032678 RepID=A0ABR3GGL9_9PEZI
MNSKTDDLSDDFIASLMSNEAKDKSIKYSTLGLQAFLPKRSTTNAPKPNTRFLRNIVREADSHNAALLAKEAEESKERLRILQLKERAKRWGEDAAGNGKGSSSRSRTRQRPDRELYRVGGRKEAPATQDGENRRGEREMKRRKSRSKSPEGSERIKDPDKERKRHRRRSRSRERRRSGSRSRKHREHRSERHHGEKERDGDRHRDRERGNDKSSEKKDCSSDKHRERRHRSPQSGRHDDLDADMDRSSRKRRKVEERTSIRASPDLIDEIIGSAPSARASPDLIDEIIGPAPPPPPTRARGRGTTSGSSAMDARFNEKYDPSMDMQPDSDDGDDWDNAAEAYRDRQKWKKLGAERLRSAGFEEDFITAWENNDTKNTANIKWAKEGVREWDRGKVVEEETGEVSVRASWAKGESGKKEGRLNEREGRLNGVWDEGRLNNGWEEGRLNGGWDEGRLNGGGEGLY